MLKAIKRTWVRFWLRGVQFASRYGRIERLYAVADPWDLASPREQARFAATNALVAALAPDCRRLLELGSGEGFQTAWLLRVSEAVTGIEVSAAAAERARRACPSASFITGTAEQAAQLLAGQRFDCVTLCETLYYASDPAQVLAAAQALADRVLVTNYAPRMARLESLLQGPGWQTLPPIEAEGTRWECRAWIRD